MARIPVALFVAISVSGICVASAAQESLVPRIIERFEREAGRQSDLLPSTLRTLAGYGPEARAASPAITKLIESEKPAIRIAAVRALGYIGHDDARQLTPKLVPFLDDVDVHMSWVAAETLGRLRDPAVIDSLAEVAASHWYPPTRAAAAEAIRHINDGSDYTNDFLFFDKYMEGFDVPSCGGHYDANRHGGSEIVVEGGRLVWRNRGEFGGELEHVDRSGIATLVYEGNVIDVHKFGRSYVIAAGLAHMGANMGHLYVLEHERGRWTANFWRRLPGAPYASTVVDNGELLVHTYGGSLIVGPDGNMRMADCPAVLQQ